MGLFGSLLNLAVDTVVLPVRVVKDVVDIPSVALGDKAPLESTTEGIKDILKDVIG